MPLAIHTIRLSMPLKFGNVNCYLINTGEGYILVDSGGSNKRLELEGKIISAGCSPGDLKLIVITHGDFDHIGNAAYLRQKFASVIAMHPDDLGMAAEGDMFSSRKSGNALIKFLAPLLFRFPKEDRFEPDLYIEDGYDFSDFGFDARALSIPGHSKGSIGILTASGELFCGDLLDNVKQPGLNSIMDDRQMAHASVQKLAGYPIGTVYPGHGEPFQMEEFLLNYLRKP
jgi:glyoxylase-like metal-dependent hydrolase (beta-lactamase superfamily II)